MSLCWNKTPDFLGERWKIILLQSVFPPADLPSYDSPPSFLFLLFDVNFFMICAANLFSTPSSLQIFWYFFVTTWRENSILYACFCCCRRTSVWLENFVGKVGADRKHTQALMLYAPAEFNELSFNNKIGKFVYLPLLTLLLQLVLVFIIYVPLTSFTTTARLR